MTAVAEKEQVDTQQRLSEAQERVSALKAEQAALPEKIQKAKVTADKAEYRKHLARLEDLDFDIFHAEVEAARLQVQLTEERYAEVEQQVPALWEAHQRAQEALREAEQAARDAETQYRNMATRLNAELARKRDFAREHLQELLQR